MFKNLMNTVKSFAADGIDLEIAGSTPLSKSQQWVLAVGSLLNAKEGTMLNTLATGTDNSILESGLKNSWGLHNRNDFMTLAQRLASLSNQAEYEIIWGEMRKFVSAPSTSSGGIGKMLGSITQYFGVANPLQMANAMKALNGKTSDDDKELAEKLNNSMQWLTEFEGMGIDATKVNNLMVWDISRLINVARWAHQIGWITEAEYFSLCTPLAQQAQRAYSSWRELTDAAFVTSMMWQYDLDRLEGFKAAHQRLLNEPKSPLLQLAWDMNLQS